jgi:hypothetical protein
MRSLAVAALLLAAAAARGEPQSPLATRYGLLVGASAPTGAIGTRFGVGAVIGVGAGYTPSWYGVVWSLQYARFWATEAREVEDLSLIDMSLLARGRLGLRGDLPAFIWVEAGVNLVRANVPLEPSMSQMFIGPQAGVGAELVLGTFIVSIGADYAALGDGPSGLRLLLFGGMGAR